MQPLKNYVECKVYNGKSVSVDGITLMPQARVLTVRWPEGGYVWNHPAAILVEDRGEFRRYPIPDTMLVVRFAILVMGLLTVILLLGATNRRKHNE